MELHNVVAVREGSVEIRDIDRLRNIMDNLIHQAVFSEAEKKTDLLLFVKEIAKAAGAIPSSIQSLYEEMGRAYPGFTVPAINIRGLAYVVARAIFQKSNGDERRTLHIRDSTFRDRIYKTEANRICHRRSCSSSAGRICGPCFYPG